MSSIYQRFCTEIKDENGGLKKLTLNYPDNFNFENDVYRVTTGCLAENIGSEKVMIKCGLIKEAEHLDWEWHDGKMKTRLEYRLLKNEWQGQQ